MSKVSESGASPASRSPSFSSPFSRPSFPSRYLSGLERPTAAYTASKFLPTKMTFLLQLQGSCVTDQKTLPGHCAHPRSGRPAPAACYAWPAGSGPRRDHRAGRAPPWGRASSPTLPFPIKPSHRGFPRRHVTVCPTWVTSC